MKRKEGVKMTKKEKEYIGFGLRVAINEEKALFHAHENVSDTQGGKIVRTSVRRNIRNWQKIIKKLEA